MEFREFRAQGVSADEGKLHGLVTPFDRETTIGDLKRNGWTETVRGGVFKKTLKEGDALMVYQHDLTKPMARKSAGNLILAEGAEGDQRGLLVDAEPVDTSYTRDCLNLIRSKVINGMSFGFNTIKDSWTDNDGNPSDKYRGTRRELLEVELVEVSPVTRPAYGGTSISARDDSNALLEARKREAEDRASSISTADRKKLASKGHALSDGSYPIPDISHLHAAAILAASGHGNVPAAKALIRKRAKALGVDVTTLPGFGASKKDAGGTPETRIKKGTAKRVIQIHASCDQALALYNKCDPKELPDEINQAFALVSGAAEHAGHIEHKEGFDASDLARSKKEPESSTPDDEDDFALLARAAAARQRSRELGFS